MAGRLDGWTDGEDVAMARARGEDDPPMAYAVICACGFESEPMTEWHEVIDTRDLHETVCAHGCAVVRA